MGNDIFLFFYSHSIKIDVIGSVSFKIMQLNNLSNYFQLIELLEKLVVQEME